MTDIHTLAGAYALHAVDDLDRARFERHLAECPSCAAEVAELNDAMAAFSDATSEAPPAGLRAAVLARSAVRRCAGSDWSRRPPRWSRYVAPAGLGMRLHIIRHS